MLDKEEIQTLVNFLGGFNNYGIMAVLSTIMDDSCTEEQLQNESQKIFKIWLKLSKLAEDKEE